MPQFLHLKNNASKKWQDGFALGERCGVCSCVTDCRKGNTPGGSSSVVLTPSAQI
jgi:hypothetical protein